MKDKNTIWLVVLVLISPHLTERFAVIAAGMYLAVVTITSNTVAQAFRRIVAFALRRG